MPAHDDTPAPDALYQHAACGLLLTADNGLIRQVNDTFCRWVGEPRDALVGQRRLQDLLTMGGRLFHQTHWAPLLQMQGSVAEIKLDLVHRDGSVVPMLLNAVRRRHCGVAVDEVAAMVVNDRHAYERELVGSRRKAEEALASEQQAQAALARSREVLLLAMRAGGMGAWSRDMVSDEIWWSRELEELLGLPVGGFAGTRDAFTDLVHEDDRAALKAAVAQALAAGTDYRVEFRIRHASGGWRWMEGRGRASYDALGNALMLHGLGIDITQRKEAQAVLLRQAAVFEHQSDAIIVTDDHGTIVDFNPACERMLGFSAAQALGQPISILYPPQDRDRLTEQALQAVQDHGEWRGEVAFVRPDGSEGICESIVKPVRDAEGKLYGIVGVNRDITERRQAQAQLLALNDELSEGARRKDEFLATLAHELRNPLAPMRNVLEIIKGSGSAGAQIDWARSVLERQVRHMTHLVDDLLDASRITQGKLTLRREPVNLADVVHAALEAAQPLLQAAGLTIDPQLPAEPLWLDADPVRMTQVVLNLVSNAVRYSPAGGRVGIAVERAGASAVIRVHDTGIGIAAADLERVFEMFEQLPAGDQRSAGGLGIGLALVKSLVGLHGGTIVARSAGPGQGSEFEVRVPVLAAAPQALAPVPRPPAPPRPAGRRVLVVDDNEDAAQSMSMLLELQGHAVCVAGDGETALAIAPGFGPDVVLLDIGLPGIDGYAVARALRQAPGGAALRLVALTGWGQDQDKARARDAGFDAHLTKPVDLDLLSEMIA